MGQKRQLKINRMSVSIDQAQALLDTDENCCEQCNLPYPLLCWRYKVKFNLAQNRLKAVDTNFQRKIELE